MQNRNTRTNIQAISILVHLSDYLFPAIAMIAQLSFLGLLFSLLLPAISPTLGFMSSCTTNLWASHREGEQSSALIHSLLSKLSFHKRNEGMNNWNKNNMLAIHIRIGRVSTFSRGEENLRMNDDGGQYIIPEYNTFSSRRFWIGSSSCFSWFRVLEFHCLLICCNNNLESAIRELLRRKETNPKLWSGVGTVFSWFQLFSGERDLR